MTQELTVIGGGLAGCEAAWQAAELGVKVKLYEMRPRTTTPAHVTDQLAELVCSNSLGSQGAETAPGLLKAEMRGLGSFILACAEESALPAGSSLAVDRERFAQLVTERIASHPGIELVREEVTTVPDGPCIIASGPLTAPTLTQEIACLAGGEAQLYFYDAISPIVSLESVNMAVAFRGSRYEKGVAEEGDYLNCPLNEAEYNRFISALTSAETITLRQFEQEDPYFFESCLPVEVLARRNEEALRFGPLRPVGLNNPHKEERPFAVVQLRQDNLAGTLYNLVGFQTNLKWGEQQRVLRLIPGLEKAEFMRYGMMHRNTYINAPHMLQPTLQFRGRTDLFFAGQIIGVEGYMGNAAAGLVAGLNSARLLQGQLPVIFPPKTMIGALLHYVTHADSKHFAPMKANFGILPPPENKMGKQERYRYYVERALTALRRFARESGVRYGRELAEQGIATAE